MPKPKRMKLTVDEFGRVTIRFYNELFDEHRRHTYTCPEKGGYVVEILADGSTIQPCRKLAHTGHTLIATSRADLPDLIRREYRALRRETRRILDIM